MEWETFSGGMVLDLENFHLSTPTIGVAVRKRPAIQYRDRAVVFDRRYLRTVDGTLYTLLATVGRPSTPGGLVEKFCRRCV